jgi:superfamily II DNA/RNA helicase
MNTSVPEEGQIVSVRQRRFVVADVEKSSLSAKPKDGFLPTAQHIVQLNSIEEDSLGEKIAVIWELELGARIEERVGLPEFIAYDSPDRLDAFLHAVEWGTISQADEKLLQSPFRSGIEIVDYQLAPLVRALQMPRVNLLIADDVGLGKTIEAGLVIQELIVRNRAQTILVVCPAGLQIHWYQQMRDKFGLNFEIVDRDKFKELRRSRGIHTNPWSHYPRLITSIDFIKRDNPMRLFREMLPDGRKYPRPFDVLVVDEAHNVAPSGTGKYALESQRTKAIRTLYPHFEHHLFLTATPHNGYKESFTSLLELVDDQRFARGVDINPKQLRQVMIRRLKDEIVDENGQPIFPQREIRTIEVDYDSTERQVHQWLRQYTHAREASMAVNNRMATEFVLKLLKKRLFSSPAAFLRTLEKHENTLTQGRQEDTPKNRTLSQGILSRQIQRVTEETYDDDEAYEDDTDAAVEQASQHYSPLTDAEKDLIEKMKSWARKASAQLDCKTSKFLDWLTNTFLPDGSWSDERLIIFTEYRTTQNWLYGVLAQKGLCRNNRVMMLYGGMNIDDRERVKAAFQADPAKSPVRILLATDAASEGIDLQRFCHQLVHFEIPWNPNRMEQRNGRIDRHGQKHNPEIYHFVSAKYKQQEELLSTDEESLEADLEFLHRVVEKIQQIREDLGKVGPVISRQVEEAMLAKRQNLEIEQAMQESAASTRILKIERDVQEKIQDYYEKVQETREALALTPENVQQIVTVALDLAGQPKLIRLETEDPTLENKAFHLSPLSGSWASCAEGLQHPHTGEIRPIVFDHDLMDGRDDIVLVHLNHRLVQMSLRLLRAQIWTPEAQSGLNRISVKVVPDSLLDVPGVVGYARLLVIGADHHSLHEELITAGGEINNGRFRRFDTVGKVDDLLAAASNKQVPAGIKEGLKSIWPDIEDSLVKSLYARMNDRVNGMLSLLERKKEKEKDDIRAILTELATSIRQQLAEADQPQQLALFSEDENEAYQRDKAFLQHRLDQIPDELEAEIAAIERHYLDPQPRMFPVALVFLVPEKMIGK